MWKDPIVAEVRQIRQAHAARFNYDLRAIVEDLKQQERASQRKFITLVPKRYSADTQVYAEQPQPESLVAQQA
jgi:hypothetical protein